MAPNLLVLHRSVEALRSHINYQIHSHRPKSVELGNTGGHSFYFLVIGKSRKGLEWFERSRNASALQVVVSNLPACIQKVTFKTAKKENALCRSNLDLLYSDDFQHKPSNTIPKERHSFFNGYWLVLPPLPLGQQARWSFFGRKKKHLRDYYNVKFQMIMM